MFLPILSVPIVSVGEHGVEDNIAYRAAVLHQLRAAVTQLQQAAPTQCITVGEDCGVETVPIGYANARAEGRMALVWIDAHGDLNTPQSSPSKHYHGMVLRTLCGEGDEEFVGCVEKTLTPDQLFMLALRNLDAPEQAFIQQHKVYFTPGLGLPSLVETIQNKGYSKVYVHFDLDALEPDAFPYMSYPTPNGLTIQQVANALETLRRTFEVVGFGITEYASELGLGVEMLDPILEQVAGIVAD